MLTEFAPDPIDPAPSEFDRPDRELSEICDWARSWEWVGEDWADRDPEWFLRGALWML